MYCLFEYIQPVPHVRILNFRLATPLHSAVPSEAIDQNFGLNVDHTLCMRAANALASLMSRLV